MSGRVGPVEAARAVLAAGESGPAVAVIARVDAEAGGERMLVLDDGTTRGTLGDPGLDSAARSLGSSLLGEEGPAVRTVETGGAVLYGEAHRPPPRLFVVGAGHIAVPLVRLAALLGFPVVVLDDREEFTAEDRFPDAVEVRRTDFADPFAAVRPGPADFVVLVTRAHRFDFDCLRGLLDDGPAPRYIGMVGSRRRVRSAFSALRDAGVAPGRLVAVHAPIGVAIGAETPEEIAVSIAAELVAVRRGVTAAGSLRDRERVVERWSEARGAKEARDG